MHIVHNTDDQNISTAQINSQFKALNADFRAKNADRTQTPDALEGAGHRFAHSVQAGQRDAHADEQESFGADDGVKRASSGGIAPIDPKTHLNVWVCPLGGGLLGYAQFPGGPQNTDGVVINYQAFGTTGTATGAVQQRAHRDARSRALPQSASHLGRHAGLQRLGHGR